MTKKIMRSIVLLSALSVIVSLLIEVVFIGRHLDVRSSRGVRNEAEMIAHMIDSAGMASLEDCEFHDIHAVICSPQGELKYDSGTGGTDTEDIVRSPEIHECHVTGRVVFRKKEADPMSDSINYALRLKNGDILHISVVQPSMLAHTVTVLQPMLLILLAVGLISVLFALKMSKNIVRPINDIDLDAPKIKKSYKEISPLIDKIRTQNKRISRQIAELRRSREQFSMITESMSEGLIIVGPKMNILACNTGAADLLGTEVPAEQQSIFSLNNAEHFRRCIQDAMGGRRSSCTVKTSAGECEVIASPSKAGETVGGIVVFIHDITDKLELETMRREFTSNVSHELKTPLTTIYGTADMIASGMVKPEDTEEFAGNIRSEAERLIALINDIVSLSKLDEGSAPHEDSEVDIYELSEEIVRRFANQAAEKNVSISLRGEHITVTGSRIILDEMISNLCDNAVKYNGDGGNVEIKISHIPTKALITVSDTGIGIPPRETERIFERFYRVDKSRSRQIKGTGLGLSIVKHGVAYHGGSIRVESTPGKGSIFTIELPLSRNQ